MRRPSQRHFGPKFGSPRWTSTMILTTSLKPYKFQCFSSFWPSRGTWILPTTSSSSSTFPLKSPSESNSCLTHIKMFKKRQQFKANVNADVSPAKRPQHAQNQFSRNICKTNRKSTERYKSSKNSTNIKQM